MSIFKKLSISFICLIPSVLVACGDDGGSSDGGNACRAVDYASFNPTETVSFKEDLAGPNGLLRSSCTFSGSCHGSTTQSQARLYLGPSKTSDAGELTDEEYQAIYDNLVGRASQESTLQRVVAGDPQNSYVMRKVDGCFDDIEAQCDPEATEGSQSGHPCGDSMPYGQDKLPDAQADLIRAWIKQGAQFN